MDEFEEKINTCAYKSISECTKEERKLQVIEQNRCFTSFWRFLKYVKIIQPPIPGQTGGGIIDIKIWEHIKQIVIDLLTESLISVLKARQIGLSTIIAAYVLWYTLSHEGANILLFSAGQNEAKELLAKSRRIYNQLPEFLQLKLFPDGTEEIGFPSKNSFIKAFASTASAGISYTASIVVADEHAEHPYADENYLSSKPTRDAGGQFISIFTENPFNKDNLATAIFEDALGGYCKTCDKDFTWEDREDHEGHEVEHKNDFKALFFPWDVVPNRDDDWYERTKKNIPERELARLSPELYMSKNYPRSIEEALQQAESVRVFDPVALRAMKENLRSPINISNSDGRWDELDCDVCHIYKDYHVGNFYIVGSDVSLGVGGDFNVTCVLDVKTADVVADICSKDIKPEEFALKSVELLRRYHSPLWWVEQNLWGRTVIKKAVELGYRRLGFRGDKPIDWTNFDDEELKRVGFLTGEKNRTDLFGALIPAINDQQITIYNEQGLKQFNNIIRNANKKGKIESMSSYHDDYPIALGICWLKKSDVHTSSAPVEPVATLDFPRSYR